MQLNCKVIKSGNRPFLHQPPPLSSKIFGISPAPSNSIFGRSYPHPPPPLIRGGFQPCCKVKILKMSLICYTLTSILSMQCITCSKLVDSFKVFFSFSWGSLLIELEVCFVIFFLHKKNQDSPPTHPSLCILTSKHEKAFA